MMKIGTTYYTYYHGTDANCVESLLQGIEGKTLFGDFATGPAFYVTSDVNLSMKFVRKKATASGSALPVILTFRVDKSQQAEQINTFRFPRANKTTKKIPTEATQLKWESLVHYCRNPRYYSRQIGYAIFPFFSYAERKVRLEWSQLETERD